MKNLESRGPGADDPKKIELLVERFGTFTESPFVWGPFGDPLEPSCGIFWHLLGQSRVVMDAFGGVLWGASWSSWRSFEASDGPGPHCGAPLIPSRGAQAVEEHAEG